MPDIYAHVLCAEGALKKMPIQIKALIEKNMPAYRLGAQGPDFFFYYNIEPWKDDEGFPKIGNKLHSEKINQFFLSAAKYIKDNKKYFSVDKIELYLAYISGFLTHYALDSIAHPYIYYISGIEAGKNHKYLEGSIDTLLMLFYGKRNSGKLIRQEKSKKTELAEFVSHQMLDVFDMYIPKYKIMQSFDDFSRTVSFLYDPSHLKKKIFSKLDKALNLDGLLITAATPTKLIKDVDYLNLKRKTWYYPADSNLKSNLSFIDLHEKAKNISVDYIKSMFDYINEEENDFPGNLGNKCYDTGLPEKRDMKYQDISVDWRKAYT